MSYSMTQPSQQVVLDGQASDPVPVLSGVPQGLRTKNSECDQEIPQSQTADNPVAPRGRAAQPPRDTRKTN